MTETNLDYVQPPQKSLRVRKLRKLLPYNGYVLYAVYRFSHSSITSLHTYLTKRYHIWLSQEATRTSKEPCGNSGELSETHQQMFSSPFLHLVLDTGLGLRVGL